MKLNVRALAITFALLWGGCVFLVAVLHRMWPAYGTGFLNGVASVYPGYHVSGIKTGLIGTAYALVDGAVCGALVAWLYNRFSAAGAGSAAKA